MSNINWSLLGANIRDRYTDAQPSYRIGEGFDKGMKDIAGTLDMYNREQAIGKMLSQRIDAQKSKIQKLESKLDSLTKELGDYQAGQAYELAQNERMEGLDGIEESRGPSLSQFGAQSMQGYHGNGMTNYNPNIQVRF